MKLEGEDANDVNGDVQGTDGASDAEADINVETPCDKRDDNNMQLKRKLTDESESRTAKKANKRKTWSEKEKCAVKRQFSLFLRTHKLPGKSECEAAKRKEPILLDRPWSQIKFCIKNMITSETRKLKT